MGCIYSIYFTETFTVAIMHQLAWNNNSLHKVTVMESDIHFISLCLGFVEQPHSLSSRVQRVLILSIAPLPINATHFHVKAQRNRWIATGEKSSYLTGRLCTCFFLRIMQHHLACPYRQCGEKSGTWIMNGVLVIKW